MERISISDALELALDSASSEYQAQSFDYDHRSTGSSEENDNAEEAANRKRKRDSWLGRTRQDSMQEDELTPTCPICLQPYADRSYLRPCYHSFCFQCISQWFRVGKWCPLCKQHTISIVYNVNEKSGFFLEYKFGDEPYIPPQVHDQVSRNRHFTSSSSSSETMGQRTLDLRRKIYHEAWTPYPGYPSVSRRHANTTHIEPYHIAKIKPFVQRELRALLEELYDPLIEKQVLEILLIPHQRHIESRKVRDGKSPEAKRAMRITMDDPLVVGPLSEWIRGGENNDGFARRFITEVMAFLRSGMDMNTFTTNVQYRREG